MIPYELDIISNKFYYKEIITYEIELTTYGKKVGFNLLDDADIRIPYITDTIPNSPSIHQLPTQAKRNVWNIAINEKESITDQGALDELNSHQTPCGKSNFKIILCRSKRYQRTYLEDIRSRFDQVRPIVSHLEFLLPKNLPYQRTSARF